MKGSIEIYNYDGLVYENDNLLVDGAGEAFADLLTISPSLSGIASASALLDTSNYTIQAISFGKGRTGFLNNAHAFDSSAGNRSLDTKETFYCVCGATTGDNNAVAVVFTGDRDTGVQTSSLSVVAGLPDFPTPMDTTLERDVQISAGAFTNPDFPLYRSHYDDDIVSLGQNLNYLPYLNNQNYVPGDEGLANYVGCYPAGSGTGGTEWYLASDPSDMHSYNRIPKYAYFDQDALYEGRVVSGTYNSYVNAASSMDSRGFIGKVYDPNGRIGINGESEPASGLIVSSISPSTTGEVYYLTNLASGDCGMAHLYGGIYTMGLWTIDNTATSGITAPYTFHPYESPQIQYKLFSKHSLSRDLTFISDDEATGPGLNAFSDLRIVWKLDFYD